MDKKIGDKGEVPELTVSVNFLNQVLWYEDANFNFFLFLV